MGKYLDGDGLSHLWAKIKSAFTNVQADWDEADPTSDAYILNKPSIPSGTVGGTNTPIYWNSGTPTATNEYVPKTGGTFTGNISVDNGGNGNVLTIGSSSTTDNTSGVTVYGSGYKTEIRRGSSWIPANNTVYLPDGVSGTLALTSQIPSVPTVQDITSTALSAADTSKATIGNLKLYALGNLRILQGYITAVSALGTSQVTVANISTGNRPADQVAVSCSWDSARYVTWGLVGIGGGIVIRSSSSYSSGNLRMNAVWIVE